MSIFTDIAGSLLKPISGIIDGFHHSGEEKGELQLALKQQEIVLAVEMEKAFMAETNAKKAIIVAEMQQGDKFTKRARPSLIYSGMAIVFLNYIILPWIAHFTGEVIPSIEVPAMFWTAWGGVTGSWVIGRSAEKRGVNNKFVQLATGNGPI